MSSQKSTLPSLQKGQLIEGKIKKLTSSEIFIDINSKTDALVLEKERKNVKALLSLLKVGDHVTASVLNPESDMGYPVVSLRRHMEGLIFASLEKLQKEQKPIGVNVTMATKGGFLAETDNGISGFLPNSQVEYVDNPQNLVGKKISVYVLEIERSADKIIFSQKKSVNDEYFDNAIKNFTIGQKILAKIISVKSFGIFAAIELSAGEQLDGLVHISEVSWEKIENLEEKFHPGDVIDVVIQGFDKEAKRIELSIKRLTPDPFEKAVEGLSVDQKVSGKVSQVDSNGVMVLLENGIEGIIRKEKIPANISYEVGSQATVTISQIDKRRRRVILVPVLMGKPMGYR